MAVTIKFDLLKYFKSDILRNTSVLISGTAIAQLIPILLQPLLRRSFTPETFGAYGVYLSLVGIIIVISSFRYELAIVLPENEIEAMSVFFLSVIINFCFNLVLFLFVFLFKSEILSILNLSSKFEVFLLLTPTGVFLFGFYQSLNYWLIRKKKFFAISLNKFVRRGGEGASQLALVVAGNSYGLIFGDLIGHIANISSGIVQGIKSGLSIRYLSARKLWYALKKYSDYPKYNFLPAFMEACSFLLPAILITRFFSAERTGYYDLARLLLSVPLALIATSLSNVLLQRISEKENEQHSIRKDLLFVLSIVSLIVLAEITIIQYFGEELFSFFFGKEWTLSGRIAKILVWSFTFNFLTSSFSSVFISLKRIKLWSIWQIFYFFAIILLFFFSKVSFESFLRIYVIIEVLCSTVISILILKIIVDYERKLLVQK